MVDKYQPDQNNINHLDKEATRLGMGGNLSPEVDENLYKKRMQKRKEIQLERVKERNLEKGLGYRLYRKWERKNYSSSWYGPKNIRTWL